MTAEPFTIDPWIGPYTVDDVLVLFPENRRVQLLEGALIVSPWPTLRHQLICDAVCRALVEAAPSGLLPVSSVNTRLGPDDQTLLVPDVVVTTTDIASDPVYVDASEVAAVVEVVSPSSRSYDRLVKPAHYAAAGIGCYWRVELGAFPGHHGDEFPVIVVHELVDGVYHETARLVPGVVGRTDRPFPLELDPADLLR